jgi:hypothetical protein
MPGHGSARPGTRSRPDGMPQRGKRKSDVKWDRVPTRSVALLRLFFVLVVLSTAAVMIMVVHLLMLAVPLLNMVTQPEAASNE